MQERTLRTIGASVILVALGVVGVVQLNEAEGVAPDVATGATSTTTLDRATSTEGAPTTTPEPFVYRLGLLSGISTDNFWAFYGNQPSVWNSYVLGPTKPALFTAGPTVGSLKPELAVSEPDPTKGEDGWSVTVDLDPEARWSDGVPVTAKDVAFTYESVRRLELEGSWADAFPGLVKAVIAETDHRVRIDFSGRPQLSVWPHGVGLAPIMPRHVWSSVLEGATAEELYQAPGDIDVSGGPLDIASISDDLIVSEANEGYRPGVGPDRVEYLVLHDEAAAVEALVQGDIDAILSPKGLTSSSIDSLEGASEVELLTSPGNGVRYLGFNLTKEPMADREFRRALALLLDREELASVISGAGPAAWALVPEGNERWFDAEAAAANAARYQGSAAKNLKSALEGLRTAGYAWERPPAVAGDGTFVAGKGLTIEGRPPQPVTILTPGDEYDPARPDYVAAIAKTLRTLGFDARPVETDFDTVVDLAFSQEEGGFRYDMYVLGWTLGNPALPGYYEALFAPDGPMNNTGYASEEFTAALERYQSSYTASSAHQALWDMERTLADDLPYLLLYSNEITEAYRSDRVEFGLSGSLGGLQARLGGIWDVAPVG